MRLPPVAAAIAALLSNPNPAIARRAMSFTRSAGSANFKIQLKIKNGDGLETVSSLPSVFIFSNFLKYSDTAIQRYSDTADYGKSLAHLNSSILYYLLSSPVAQGSQVLLETRSRPS